MNPASEYASKASAYRRHAGEHRRRQEHRAPGPSRNSRHSATEAILGSGMGQYQHRRTASADDTRNRHAFFFSTGR